MAKPFLTEDAKKNIIFHSSLQFLHDYVPKEILPQELGGDMGPYDNSYSTQAVFAMKDHFEIMEQCVSANKELV